MERVVPWKVLVEIIEPHWPKSKTGRPPFAIVTMLRIHYMQQWFGLSDPAMEEALHDVPLHLEFAGLGSGASRIPDETTILRFRHLLEKHDLAVDMLRVVNDLPPRHFRGLRTKPRPHRRISAGSDRRSQLATHCAGNRLFSACFRRLTARFRHSRDWPSPHVQEGAGTAAPRGARPFRNQLI